MSKPIRALSLTLLLITLAAAFAGAQTDAQKAFAAIKSMPGSWEGKSADGRPLQVTFKVVSGGSAVMSEIVGQGPEDMISMFNLDGPNQLLFTHYCTVAPAISLECRPVFLPTAKPSLSTFSMQPISKQRTTGTCSGWCSL